MSLLTRPAPSDAAGSPAAPLHSPFALGSLAAVQAVFGSLLCVVAPVLGIWIASTRTDATWSEAVRIAADAWLLAHHTGIAVEGGHVGLTPLGLTLLPAAWCWAGGRRMAIALGMSAGVAAPGRSGRRALLAFTACYALLATVVSLLAASPVARPLSGQALLGGAVLAGGVGGLAMLRASRTPTRPLAWSTVSHRARLPGPVARMLPAAGIALAVWVAAGSIVVALALVLGHDSILATHEALRPGPAGSVGLALAQVLLVPVAVVWASAWLAGPGFAVGAGTTVNPWFADLGALPAIPLLGVLPGGTLPAAVPAVMLAPVLAGALAGVWLRRQPRPDAVRLLPALVDAALCGMLAGVGAGLLCWLASGPLGPGRMAVVGPQEWLVALAVAAEVAVGCAIALMVPRRRRRSAA